MHSLSISFVLVKTLFPSNAFFFFFTCMISLSMFLEEGAEVASAKKVKNFQKHFSWPTCPQTKPAVNWSRFHFLITFSWGTIAGPLPNPGHCRALAFFPRQLGPTPPSRTLSGNARCMVNMADRIPVCP